MSNKNKTSPTSVWSFLQWLIQDGFDPFGWFRDIVEGMTKRFKISRGMAGNTLIDTLMIPLIAIRMLGAIWQGKDAIADMALDKFLGMVILCQLFIVTERLWQIPAKRSRK